MPDRPARPRVLVVDDGALIRLFYRETLEAAGFEVVEALNGIEAMEKVLSEPFDLLVVDINMPKMDGVSFLRNLRGETGAAAAVPALVISSESGEQDAEDARAAGANYYLVKPVAAADLVLHVAVLTGVPA
ncbi:response regulator [Skermanella pratensis]|uniref:response regulator n=1 Tax=Skermanella pratensis TaxID=2233999 RepID=UPI0013018524|nr:response regulator [Skermanella pratensis]